jgi:hypothetical protein
VLQVDLLLVLQYDDCVVALKVIADTCECVPRELRFRDCSKGEISLEATVVPVNPLEQCEKP